MNHNRKGPGKPGPNITWGKILKLAKQLDTPEMRELYRRQQVINPDLDSDLEEMAEEIEDIFKHDKDSQNDKT